MRSVVGVECDDPLPSTRWASEPWAAMADDERTVKPAVAVCSAVPVLVIVLTLQTAVRILHHFHIVVAPIIIILSVPPISVPKAIFKANDRRASPRVEILRRRRDGGVIVGMLAAVDA